MCCVVMIVSCVLFDVQCLVLLVLFDEVLVCSGVVIVVSVWCYVMCVV